MLNDILKIIRYDESEVRDNLLACLRQEILKWACILDITECRRAATFQLIRDLENPIKSK